MSVTGFGLYLNDSFLQNPDVPVPPVQATQLPATASYAGQRVSPRQIVGKFGENARFFARWPCIMPVLKDQPACAGSGSDQHVFGIFENANKLTQLCPNPKATEGCAELAHELSKEARQTVLDFIQITRAAVAADLLKSKQLLP